MQEAQAVVILCYSSGKRSQPTKGSSTISTEKRRASAERPTALPGRALCDFPHAPSLPKHQQHGRTERTITQTALSRSSCFGPACLKAATFRRSRIWNIHVGCRSGRDQAAGLWLHGRQHCRAGGMAGTAGVPARSPHAPTPRTPGRAAPPLSIPAESHPAQRESPSRFAGSPPHPARRLRSGRGRVHRDAFKSPPAATPAAAPLTMNAAVPHGRRRRSPIARPAPRAWLPPPGPARPRGPPARPARAASRGWVRPGRPAPPRQPR